jgi:uncharacterized protein with HEPN domain
VSRADDERITDIVEAASEIAAIVDAGREAWESDHVRQLAVERLLEIIGESARAMTDGGRAQYPGYPRVGHHRFTDGLGAPLPSRGPGPSVDHRNGRHPGAG